MSISWGERLRVFRLNAGYETLSQFSDALYEIEPIYLDSSTLSRYENDAKRLPKQRERHLLLAEALVKGGGIKSITQLNEWLATGGMGHLTPEEEARLFPQEPLFSPVTQSEPEPEKRDGPTAVSPPPVLTRPAGSKRPYLLAFAGLASIIAILLFIGSFYIPPDPGEAPLPARTNTAVFTPTSINSNLIANDSFEAAIAEPWAQPADCTLSTFALETNRTQAKAGEQYLIAATDTADCYSFRQDIPIPDTLTGTVSFGIYARAADETARYVTLALWTGTGMGETFNLGSLNNNNGEARFLIGGEEWHCLEISLDFATERYTTLRAEIYLDTPDGQAYAFDEAWLKAGLGGDCPPLSDQLRNISFENETAYPWATLPNCPDNLIQLQRVEDTQEGRQVVVATGYNEDCRSFYQDVAHTAVLSDTYTFSIWGRSPTGNPVQGVMGLWARHDNRAEQRAETRFLIAGQEWQCLEVQLTLTQTRSTHLRPEVYLDSTDGTPYEFDQAQLSLQSNTSCPPRPLALRNSSFEDTPLVYWQAYGCTEPLLPFLDTAVALPAVDGQQYLVVERLPESGCISFYQDSYTSITPDETYYYSIWVRSPDGTPRSGRIALWAIGEGTEEANGHDFTVTGNEWHCLETTLTVRGDQYTHLRSEVYLDELGQAYHFDHALLSNAQTMPCPPTDIFPGQMIIDGNGSFYAGSSLPFRVELRNGSATSISHHQTRFWVSTTFNGEPFDTAVLRTIPHPEVMPAGSQLIITNDVRLPNALTPGDYYFVVEVDGEDKLNEANEENNRHSIPFTIVPCVVGGSTFCDVPAEYPGRPEMEQWREQGITVGCNRIPIANDELLFFCPTEKVLRDILAVVIMRHVRGGQYRPEDPVEGIFTDTPLDDSLTPWVEALARQGITLSSDACPSTAVEPRFCPKQVVTKGDLARYLAELLAWELPETADGTFVDVTGSSLEARAITYMAQQGYLADGVVDCVPEQFPLQEGERAFCADEAVTRGDTAVLMVRAYDLRSTTPEP